MVLVVDDAKLKCKCPGKTPLCCFAAAPVRDVHDNVHIVASCSISTLTTDQTVNSAFKNQTLYIGIIVADCCSLPLPALLSEYVRKLQGE